MAAGVADSSRQREIRELTRQVRQHADELVRDATAYDNDPNNGELEQRYAATQKRLADSIGAVVHLCGDQAAKDALGSLFGLQGGSGDGSIFRLIDSVIEEIDAVQGSLGDDAQRGVNAAQSIGLKCKDLSAQLRVMANNPEADGAFREQLNSYAGGVRDQALQIKIISAVKLADHGSDSAKDKNTSSGQNVRSQVVGMRRNLVDLKKQLFAEALKRRTSNTKKQADAIARIAAAFIARK